MKRFSCENCNYSTDDKSNYNKHLKSQGHTQLTQNNKKVDSRVNGKVNKLVPNKKKFICSQCNKEVLSASSLSRHKSKYCKNIYIEDNDFVDREDNIQNDNEFIDEDATDLFGELIDKYNIDSEIKQKLKNDCTNILNTKIIEAENRMLKQQLEEKDNKLKEKDKELKKEREQNKTNTFNISVKNYIQQNYADAPHLLKLKDYSILEKQDEDDEYDFAKILRCHFDRKMLHHYLGDFIIKQYKKKDPTKRSIWNSDVSRLSYIIKELLANKKSCWSHDAKGEKTKGYIIEPLLEYIKEYCLTYIMENTPDNDNKANYDKINNITNALGNIVDMIDKKELANDIVKYIAPHFSMDKQMKLIEN